MGAGAQKSGGAAVLPAPPPPRSLHPGPSCSNLGYDNPARVGSKFEFRYESLKSKFSLILFVNNLMIGYSKKNRENCPRKCF